MPTIDLSGRHARVTSAHSGLGRAIALNSAAAPARTAALLASAPASYIAGTSLTLIGGMLIYPDLSHRG